MALRWYSTVIDANGVATLARWWPEVLDWEIAYEADPEGNEFCILSSRDS